MALNGTPLSLRLNYEQEAQLLEPAKLYGCPKAIVLKLALKAFYDSTMQAKRILKEGG